MDDRRGNAQAGDLIATYRVIATSTPFACEDCGMPTDLGFKCRACYARWQRELWRDIPREHARLLRTLRELHAYTPKTERAEIAKHALDSKGAPLSDSAKALLGDVLACMKRGDDDRAGPFDENMRIQLRGIIARVAKSAVVDDDEKPTARKRIDTSEARA